MIRPIALVLLTIGAAACGTSERVSGLEFAVDEVGPFNTGFRMIDVTYTPIAGGATRTVVLHVWYPTRDPLPTEPPYARYDDNVMDMEIVGDARLARRVYDEGYPVVVYSHGDHGLPEGSARLMRYFASHGWIAVAPGHVGNRLLDGTRPFSDWYHRPLDVSASLDALDALPGSDPLAGKLITSAVLATGHSRGSYTTWALAGAGYDVAAMGTTCASESGACTAEEMALFQAGFRDPRIVAVIPTAGSGCTTCFGAGVNDVTIPVYTMTASNDDVGASALFATATAVDHTWVEFSGGCHELFNLGISCPPGDDAALFPPFRTLEVAIGRLLVLADPDPRTAAIVGGTEILSDRLTFMVP